MKRLTIFTPTYNRKNFLSKCYESLLVQTCKEFVWQIIDDGSTDDTESLVRKWIDTNIIEIEYVKKSNGGKVRAIADSLARCQTQLWMCLDSDDYLTEDAVETILSYYQELYEDERCCGLFAVRTTPDGLPMQGARFNKKINKLPYKEKYMAIRYKHRIPPEYVMIFKTDIIQRYSYPDYKDERFMPESSVYCLMDSSYHYITVKKPMMVCEYEEGGLTLNHKRHVLKNPKGYTYTQAIIAEYVPFSIWFFRAAICYHMGRFNGGDKHFFKSKVRKFIIKAMTPIGYIVWKIKYTKEIC